MIRKLLSALLAIGVVAAGIAVAMGLVATRPAPKQRPRQDSGTLVEVIRASAERRQVEVEAKGTVIPARQVMLQPEVPGRVVWLNPSVVVGGKLKEGERLAKIDDRDYRLALDQQKAQVDRAQLELEVERSRKKIAEREWELLGDAPSEADALALREPQLRTARNAVEASRSGLSRAQLAVARTTLVAPFNAFVQSESLELGQLVAPQAPVATLVGTDHFWVQVSVPVEKLAWLAVPGMNAEAQKGAAARVRQDVGGAGIERAGRVVRLLGALDPSGGMAQLVVEIDDPLGLAAERRTAPGDASALPLLLGAFVHVAVAAGELEGVYPVPRAALRDGEHVFLLGKGDTLEIRPVRIAWRGQDEVLVKEGLAEGDLIITTPIAAPLEGMALRTAGREPRVEREP